MIRFVGRQKRWRDGVEYFYDGPYSLFWDRWFDEWSVLWKDGQDQVGRIGRTYRDRASAEGALGRLLEELTDEP